jgi:hypothetical protein
VQGFSSSNRRNGASTLTSTASRSRQRIAKQRRRQDFARYFSFAYSAFAAMRIGMSGSASFQSVRKSL